MDINHKFIQENPSQYPDTVLLTEIFNEQHAAQMFQQKLIKKPNFHKIIFKNVGVKIMKDALDKFEEQQVSQIDLHYNWNEIMVMPKLVCYDKNTWKTLQQLSNWNRNWGQLFTNCPNLQLLNLKITCSYIDDQYVKALLEGIAKLPNIQYVNIDISAKNDNIIKMLEAFKNANIFNQFNYNFIKYENKV